MNVREVIAAVLLLPDEDRQLVFEVIGAVDGLVLLPIGEDSEQADKVDAEVDGQNNLRHREMRSDLIEVKPRIQRDVWVNVYDRHKGEFLYKTREEADERATHDRLACVKIPIDCEHGEGLE